ncbi:MAG TPA: FKBP-type peptidyl-prolyl cis-trans isomerase [Thiobacillaceae bacterium]|nr:FKBP-type peptidyl-prolyl cis-trans isomerase [Thiobacillaceae bacterium]
MNEDVIRNGKVVFITYSVLDEAGRVMGQQDMPTGYVQGAGSGLFAPIERGLEGHCVGERVEISVSPEEGFGPRDPELTIVEDLDNVPPEFRRVGAEAEFQNEAGDVVSFRVVQIKDGQVTLDGNHPLAGQTATCVVDVVSVREATAQEVETGFPLEQGPPPMH